MGLGATDMRMAPDGVVEVTDPNGEVILRGKASWESAQKFLSLMETNQLGMRFTMEVAPKVAADKASPPPEKHDGEKPEAASQEQMKNIIIAHLEKLSGDYRHTSEDHQMWVLGRTIQGESGGLRSKLDRARTEAFETLGAKLGGRFEKAGKVGRIMTYKFHPNR